MSDFDDAVGDMATDLLAEAGGSFVYLRDNVTTTVTARKSVMAPILIETVSGNTIEVRPVDFLMLTADLPYPIPLKGDQFKAGGLTWEVQPTTSEKVFRQISPQMTRIHTKQVG